jgi:hypothetical protein
MHKMDENYVVSTAAMLGRQFLVGFLGVNAPY